MYLHKNLEYFQEYNKEMLLKIKDLDHSNHPEVIDTGKGMVFKLEDDSGNEYFSGSIYDPGYETEQLLKDINFDNTGYILIGLNSTETFKKIIENKTDNSWLFVIEKDINTIKALLNKIDLTNYLDNKPQRIVFFYGECDVVEKKLKQYLHSLVGFYFLQAEIIRTYPTYKSNKTYYINVYRTVSNTILNNVYNIGNDLDDTILGIKNELANLKNIIKQPKLKVLKNKFENVPIICVASGPSLDKQLELLKSVQGKAIIISAESAFKSLIRNGIEPDILCILERGKNSYEVSISDIKIPEKTALFGLTLIDTRIMIKWPKYIVPCFKENLVYSRFINDTLGDFGTFISGNSVAHFSYMLAAYLGGNPITFIGQDLSYSEDGKHHSKDSLYYDTSISTDHLEIDNQKKKVLLEGYYGGQVQSTKLWKQFLIWMETLINISQNKTFNSTEGGAKISGAENIPFKDFINNYCTEKLNETLPEVIDLYVNRKDNFENELIELRKKYKTLKDEFELVVLRAKEQLFDSEKLINEIKSNNHHLLEIKTNRLFERNELLIKSILSNEYLAFYFRPLISLLHIRTNKIARLNNIKRIEEVIEHYISFLKEVSNGGEKFINEIFWFAEVCINEIIDEDIEYEITN